MLVFELDSKHGVRQRLDDRSFDLDCISLGHRRLLDPDYLLVNAPDAGSDRSTGRQQTPGNSRRANNKCIRSHQEAASAIRDERHALTPAGIAPAADTQEYSNDGGATWAYVPTDSGDGTDPAVTHMRMLYAAIPGGLGSVSTFQVIIQ